MFNQQLCNITFFHHLPNVATSPHNTHITILIPTLPVCSNMPLGDIKIPDPIIVPTTNAEPLNKPSYRVERKHDYEYQTFDTTNNFQLNMFTFPKRWEGLPASKSDMVSMCNQVHAFSIEIKYLQIFEISETYNLLV